MSQNNEDIRTIHISDLLSSKKIIELIDTYPNLKEISCPPSLYIRTSPKYLEALEELGIVVKEKQNWGQTRKYNEDDEKDVVEMIKKEISPSEIAKKKNISIKAVYYLKDKNKNERIILKKGKSSKYNKEIKLKIKKLAKEGISPKNISQNENIPLRTVYYIINNK